MIVFGRLVAGLALLVLIPEVRGQPVQPQPEPLAKPEPKPAAKTRSKPTSQSTPAKSAFEFRSHRIGDPLEATYPGWRHGKPDLSQPGCRIEHHEIGIVSCDDVESFEYERSGFMTTSRQVVGGVRISLLTYKFFDGKLYSLDMGFDFRKYSEIREMLVGKYGKPVRDKASNIQNRAGANFENITSEWDFREGTLKLNMRYGTIDMSWLTFENPAVEQSIQVRRGAIGEQKGKKAF